MSRWTALTALTVLALIGCQSTTPGPSTKRVVAESDDPNAPKPMLVVPTETRCAPKDTAKLENILKQVARMRHIEAPASITCMTVKRSGVKMFFKSESDREWDERTAATFDAYRILGLIPRGMNVKEWMLDLMSQQVAGFYNSKSKKVYMVGTSQKTGLAGDVIWAHELTHLLDDKMFDLEAGRDKVKYNDDRLLAYTALVEGSATGIMAEYAVQQAPGLRDNTALAALTQSLINYAFSLALNFGDNGRKFEQSPLIIQEMLMFPYIEGMKFRNAVKDRLGTPGVNAMFSNPPESTEQILHPSRFLDRLDRPQDIQFPPTPRGWKLACNNSLGMLGLKVFLQQHSHKIFRPIADGWDGDLLALWDTPEGQVLAWVIVWDDETQAKKFADWMRMSYIPPRKDQASFLRSRNVSVLLHGFPKVKRDSFAKQLLGNCIITSRPGDQELQPGHK